MTRSIFDPGGRETERSGSTFRSQEADNRSHLPPSVSDGEVSPEEQAEADAVADADAAGLTPEERIAAIPEVDARDVSNDPDAVDGTGPEDER
jgi:hypothetical protein